MKYKEINEAVLYNQEKVCTLNYDDLLHLQEKGLGTAEQRTRLCVHDSPDASIHEMFIVHTDDTYVRPHKHKSRAESFEVLKGEASLLLLDDFGEIEDIIELGELLTNKTFFFKMPAGAWHMLIIHSQVLIFKEVTQGPFDSSDCVFPDWAPPGRNCTQVEKYMDGMMNKVKRFMENNHE